MCRLWVLSSILHHSCKWLQQMEAHNKKLVSWRRQSSTTVLLQGVSNSQLARTPEPKSSADA